MSKNNLPNLSFEERRKLGAAVKELRTGAKLKQADLAELAGVSRQTLSNIERGAVPQVDNLRRIYEVLGVDIAPAELSDDTQQWLAVIGGLLEVLPSHRRTRAGRAAVTAVTNELTTQDNVIVGRFGQNAEPADLERAAFEDDGDDGADLEQ